MCCPLVFEFSVGIGGFVIGLGQISFFFSLHHDRKTHIEFPVIRLKVKVIMTHKQTIISSSIAMNVFNVKTSYFIFQQ